MELEILLDPKLSKRAKNDFYKYLKSKQTKDIEKIEWKTVQTKPGEMGNGAGIQAIGTVVASAQTGVVELFKTIQAWIELHKKEVSIKGPMGDEFTFKTNKLSEMTLLQLADKFVVDSRIAEKELRSNSKTKSTSNRKTPNRTNKTKQEVKEQNNKLSKTGSKTNANNSKNLKNPDKEEVAEKQKTVSRRGRKKANLEEKGAVQKVETEAQTAKTKEPVEKSKTRRNTSKK